MSEQQAAPTESAPSSSSDAGGGTLSASEALAHAEAQQNRNLERGVLLYLIGGVMLLASWIGDNFIGSIPPEVAALPALIAAVLLGFPLFISAFKELMGGRFSTAMLASIAIAAAIATEQYRIGGILALILLLANQFVQHRAWGAERAIAELIHRTPDDARVIRDGQEVKVRVSEVRVGDTVRVRPGENLPVDGVITSGSSAIDQSSLTGEMVPHEVQPGEPVYAGTTNLSAVVELKVTEVGEETTIGKVSQLIREAEQSKTPRQLLIEQVASFFVPVAIAVAVLVWYINAQDAELFIAVLVVASPAALLLSSPSAMVAAFAAAARLGILIKRTSYLEAAASVDTVVMDKTGTITTGKFAVSRLVPAEGVEGATLLQAAVNGEQHSNHPLARSILATAEKARIEPDGSDEFEEIHGRGIRAGTSMGEIHVGRSSWIVELFPALTDEVRGLEARIEGMSGVHVVLGGKYLGVVGLEDSVKPNTEGVIERLRSLGVRSVAIYTGDRLSVAERVGRQVGVDTVEAECLPEEKHEEIRRLTASGRHTMMVGDGINDGPSLAAADVGVAMGLSGSDIAANSAGVALMTDDLSRIAFLIELSRRTRTIIGQNIAVSVVIAIIGLALAAMGVIGVIGSAVYQLLPALFVFANSFRLFRYGEAYTEADQAIMLEPIEPAMTARQARLAAAAS